MPLRLPLFVFALVLVAGVLQAGEDVQLMDGSGSVISPSRIDDVDLRATCGACHDDFDSKAKSVHFVRKDKSADPGSVDCLSCHMGKFTSTGTIDKTPALPTAQACQSCHPDAQTEHKAMPHAGMSCYDCHKNSGHKSEGAASCDGCHNGLSDAPKPKHAGFTKLHIDSIACTSCHLAGAGTGTLGFIVKNKLIAPVDADGNPAYHGVAPAHKALGAVSGCADCHSTGSKFFFGTTTTGDTDDNGNPIRMANHKSLGLAQRGLQAGAIRETLIKPLSKWLFILVIVLCAVHYFVFGPRRAKVSPKEEEIQRFDIPERVFHLMALVSFVFLATTGMAFLLHLESPTSALRAVHGWVGGIFGISVVGMLILWRRHGVFTKCDLEWVKMMGGYLWIKGECPAEKFNAGQKAYFWVIAVLFGVVISTTGIILIAGRGQAAGWVFTVHDLAAVVLGIGVISHAYLSIFANPGTIHSMLTGRVKKSWAEHHHPDWYRKHAE